LAPAALFSLALAAFACTPPASQPGTRLSAREQETPQGLRPARDLTPGATGTSPNGPQVPLTDPAPDSVLTPPSATALPPLEDTTNRRRRSAPQGLFGRLTAPSRLLSDQGGALISNNGGNVISNNGAAVLSNNGGGLISDAGGSLLGKVRLHKAAKATYSLLALEPHRALTQGFLYLTDPDERFILGSGGGVLATTVGTDGFFQFPPDYPTDRDVVVNAQLNDNLRMTGYVRPGPTTEVNLNLGSTLATELLRGEAKRLSRSLSSFAYALFRDLAASTQALIEAGIIASVLEDQDASGTVAVARFDLRADQRQNLRNQYVVALSAAKVTNGDVLGLSEGWKALLGYRPSAVTSVLGNGEAPYVESDIVNKFLEVGFAEGDTRGSSPPLPLKLPLGYNYSVACSSVVKQDGSRDVFLGCATAQGSSGHIRWLRIDAEGTLRKVTTLWLPTYAVGQPLGICLEKPPTGNVDDPGSLLVADPGTNRVYRIYLVDDPTAGAYVLPGGTQFNHDKDDSTPQVTPVWDTELHLMEIVAGEATPSYTPDTAELFYLDAEHPLVVDNGTYPGLSPQASLLSGFRASDEGARTYADNAAIRKPARYAHLDQPWDVEVDKAGNIYIADKGNHRIRFIPKVDGPYFGYREPVRDANQVITGFGAAVNLKAGAIYTIAGNPSWDPNKVPSGSTGWFGAYAGDGGPAQAAKFDQPFALAWNEADQCLYVADFDNQRVRKISRATGIVTTVAGNPTGDQVPNGQGDWDYKPADSAADAGDDRVLPEPIQATQARLSYPRGIAFDAKGRLYIADSGAGLIRVIDTDGKIRTVAGRFHAPGTNGTDNARDGDARNWADLYDTEKIDLDPAGNVFLQDYRHGRLRILWRQWEQ
jgi:sugar lactone lactonase YvrE